MKPDRITVPDVTKKNLFVQALLFFRWPLLFPPIRWVIRRELRYCRNIDFIPGFRFLFGNIHAENVYFCDTYLNDYAPIHIGKGTYFSYDCSLYTSFHDYRSLRKVYAKPIYIGRNVWIASKVIVLGGVEIGDNCVIGAGSVVTRSIPKNSFAAGNPARVIKKI